MLVPGAEDTPEAEGAPGAGDSSQIASDNSGQGSDVEASGDEGATQIPSTTDLAEPVQQVATMTAPAESARSGEDAALTGEDEADQDAEDEEAAMEPKSLATFDAGDGFTDCGGLSIRSADGATDGFAYESVTWRRIGRGYTEDSRSDNGRSTTIPRDSAVTDSLNMLVIKKSGTYG